MIIFRSFIEDIHRIPCLSLDQCVPLPFVGENIQTEVILQTDGNLTADFKCVESNASFFIQEVNYDANFTIPCEKKTIFGKTFPYWRIPETNYPEKTEIVCIKTTECFDFPLLNKMMDQTFNFSNTFDTVQIKNDNTFEYYCDTEGERGMI